MIYRIARSAAQDIDTIANQIDDAILRLPFVLSKTFMEFSRFLANGR